MSYTFVGFAPQLRDAGGGEWTGRMNSSAPNPHILISARTYQLPVSLFSLWLPHNLLASYFLLKVMGRPSSHRKQIWQSFFSFAPKSRGGKIKGKEELKYDDKTLRVYPRGRPG